MVRRLNWGCGPHPEPGWINSDRQSHPGVDLVCDIRDGLPLDTESIDYVVSIHALPEVPYPDLLQVLGELRRVLKNEGVLRLCLPDLQKGYEAYARGDREYFLIPDEDMRSVGGKLILQLIWYGHTRTPFVPEFAEELLLKAGFRSVHHLGYRETSAADGEIVRLDSRAVESFFVEAVK
jgi:ubiquinone/menaquinone biosynthesis C-methylase UbiE